jgi:hypothetical protein
MIRIWAQIVLTTILTVTGVEKKVILPSDALKLEAIGSNLKKRSHHAFSSLPQPYQKTSRIKFSLNLLLLKPK